MRCVVFFLFIYLISCQFVSELVRRLTRVWIFVHDFRVTFNGQVVKLNLPKIRVLLVPLPIHKSELRIFS